ncbi:hypothetical protein [Megasphaera hominis]|jgi:hypothetical protein|uniref:Uncharacterized protein n=1 Tax=Megasphaera hominis TaxID=159836 RepID=A0ABR6VJ16_9FIRM|nr:hypothetical protein [Megasphaera hominis]MBC3537284.1 hypothetical protein [Megasphaera hominis]
MIHNMTHHLKDFRKKFERDDDFEEFLFILTFSLFCLLFIRVLVAIYMGHWGLFE